MVVESQCLQDVEDGFFGDLACLEGIQPLSQYSADRFTCHLQCIIAKF